MWTEGKGKVLRKWSNLQNQNELLCCVAPCCRWLPKKNIDGLSTVKFEQGEAREKKILRVLFRLPSKSAQNLIDGLMCGATIPIEVADLANECVIMRQGSAMASDDLVIMFLLDAVHKLKAFSISQNGSLREAWQKIWDHNTGTERAHVKIYQINDMQKWWISDSVASPRTATDQRSRPTDKCDMWDNTVDEGSLGNASALFWSKCNLPRMQISWHRPKIA